MDIPSISPKLTRVKSPVTINVGLAMEVILDMVGLDLSSHTVLFLGTQAGGYVFRDPITETMSPKTVRNIILLTSDHCGVWE